MNNLAKYDSWFDSMFNFDWFPATIGNYDLVNDEKELTLKTIMPGISKKDVSVFIDENDMLRIKVTNKEVKKDKLLKQFYYEKSYYLSKKYDKDNISAEMKNGVLEIKIPKIVESKNKSKMIEIR